MIVMVGTLQIERKGTLESFEDQKVIYVGLGGRYFAAAECF